MKLTAVVLCLIQQSREQLIQPASGRIQHSADTVTNGSRAVRSGQSFLEALRDVFAQVCHPCRGRVNAPEIAEIRFHCIAQCTRSTRHSSKTLRCCQSVCEALCHVTANFKCFPARGCHTGRLCCRVHGLLAHICACIIRNIGICFNAICKTLRKILADTLHLVLKLIPKVIQTRPERCKKRISDAIQDRAKRTVFCSKGVYPAGGVQWVHQLAHFAAFFANPCFQLFPQIIQRRFDTSAFSVSIPRPADQVDHGLDKHFAKGQQCRADRLRAVIDSIADGCQDRCQRRFNVVCCIHDHLAQRSCKCTQHCQDRRGNAQLDNASRKCTEGFAKADKTCRKYHHACRHRCNGTNGKQAQHDANGSDHSRKGFSCRQAGQSLKGRCQDQQCSGQHQAGTGCRCHICGNKSQPPASCDQYAKCCCKAEHALYNI